MDFFDLRHLHPDWRFTVPGLVWLGVWQFGPGLP